MKESRWWLQDTAMFALIGLAEFLIFFRHPGHFFMGDTLFWMGTRYRSVSEFLSGFYHLDPFDWYRPLAQRTVESLLYPIAGLSPAPYHLVIFALFFLCTVSVFVLAETITQSRRAAWIATLFFASHITHAVTTSDTAFAPELMFTMFSIVSAVAYVQHLRTRSSRMLIVSAAAFMGALLSKETAVALPLVILAIWLLFPQKRTSGLRSLVPHFVILAAYLVFAVGYLHIRGVSFEQLLATPGTVQGGYYELSLGRNVIETSGHAFSWAFSIPRGEFGQWKPTASPRIARRMISALKVVRVLICAAALLVLFSPQRNQCLFGMIWFFAFAAPTLPILNHFLPYYMFAPMVGFAIAVGVVLDWIFRRLSPISPRLALAVCTVMILIPAVVDANMATDVAENYFLAGGSQKAAQNQLADVQVLHSSLPKGTGLLIFDEENNGTSWNQAKGKLFQMAYKDETLKAEYIMDGLPISSRIEQFQKGETLAFKLINGRLVEFTSFVKQRPDLLLPHGLDDSYSVELSRWEVHAGDDYLLRVRQLKSASVNVLRAFNGTIEEPLVLNLDSSGEARIKVPGDTRPGIFTFVAVRRADAPAWCTVHTSIKVVQTERGSRKADEPEQQRQ